MTQEVTIYHNPRCSKSRQALALLEARGLPVRVIEYLRTPPSRSEIETLLRQLGMPAASLVRKSEEIFRTAFAGRDLDEADWIDAMAEHPILIERPIVVAGERAVVGRPPERVLDIV